MTEKMSPPACARRNEDFLPNKSAKIPDGSSESTTVVENMAIMMPIFSREQPCSQRIKLKKGTLIPRLKLLKNVSNLYCDFMFHQLSKNKYYAFLPFV